MDIEELSTIVSAVAEGVLEEQSDFTRISDAMKLAQQSRAAITEKAKLYDL